jgi:tetratricopeptide (TPR) repeat protein
MKKLFLTVLGTAIFAVPTLSAQDLGGIPLTVEKVNVEKLESAIAKSDATIADAKKSAKASTWIKRGETMLDVDTKPTNGLFNGLEESMLKLSYGDAEIENVTLGSAEYVVYNYEHFKAYVKDGQVAFYLPTTVVEQDALEKAYEAYDKAYTLDPKSAKKVDAGMTNIHNRAVEYGSAYYPLAEYKKGADNFRMAYKTSVHPAVTSLPTDTMSIFYAGFLGTIAGEYELALQDLNKAIELGYESNGDSYYYKYFCLYSTGDRDGALETLKYAIGLYPNNNDIIEGLLQLYSTGNEDPSNLIPMVLNAIEENPTNAGLHLGLANVYDKLGESDNSIASAKRAAELDPSNFFSSYYEGFYTVKKADNEDSKLRSMTITSSRQYDEVLAAVNAVYSQAVAPLERAYEIDPSQIATVELLKNLTFRLREDPAMNAKFEKYDALYKSMNTEE